MSKEFPFYGEKIIFSDEIIMHNDLRSNFVKLEQMEKSKMSSLICDLKKAYKEDGDYEKYIESLIMQIMVVISNAFDFSIYTLMYYEIDFYSKYEFIERIGEIDTPEFYEELGIREPLEDALQYCEDIENVKSDIADIRAAQRSERGQYVSLLSTNLDGAISGEISAGIMNLGLNAVRSLKDSLTDTGDKAKIKKEIDAVILGKNFLSKFMNAVMNPYLRCFLETAVILWENHKFICPFSDKFFDENETTMSKIRNYVEFGNEAVAMKMVKEHLQLNPYNMELYIMMYNLCGDESCDLIRLAKYFDMDSDYREVIGSKINDINYFESTDFLALLNQTEIELKDYRKEYLV